jgi:hypothetical protein
MKVNPRRLGVVVLLASMLALGGILGPFALARMGAPVSYTEADLDHDGWVSLTEGSYLFDAGQRRFGTGSQVCVEYFALKSGHPIKTVCE